MNAPSGPPPVPSYGRRIFFALTSRYVMVLTLLGALWAGSYVFFDDLVAQQQTLAKEVNVSGRQRMLSQRLTLLASSLATAPSEASRKAIGRSFDTALDLFEKTHLSLVNGDTTLGVRAPRTQKLKALYFGPDAFVDRDVRAFIATMRAARQGGGLDVHGDNAQGRLARHILAGGLLVDLNRVVEEHQREAEDYLEQLRRQELIVLIIGLLTLLGTGVFVMYPVVARVRDQVRRLREHEEELEHANRAKADFLATMSHELRTPLNAIIGFSHIIATRAFGNQAEDRYTEYAQHITGSGQHLLALINEILDFATLDQEKLKLELGHVDLTAVARSSVHALTRVAEDKGVVVNAVLAGRDVFVRGDKVRLRQVLDNLLANAVKYTDEDGTVTLTLDDEGHDVVVSVRDTGVGMTEEQALKAREPFVQINRPGHDKQEGIGLGLPLAISFVALHGGSVDITSTPGEGTTVKVTIPKDVLEAA